MMYRPLLRLLILVGVLIGSISVCHAQLSGKPSFEFDLDFRSRLAAVGNSRTALYTSSMRMNSDLASGWKVNLNGAQKYRTFLAQEATVEKQWGNQRLQGGIVRLPFGIYDSQETYSSGLIDYPMPRSDYALNSVSWGVPGVAWSGGTPKLQVETAGFSGRSAGLWNNPNVVSGASVRVQTYQRGLILGASHWNGYLQTSAGPSSHQGVSISGVDVRYTRPHLLLRGEFLAGRLGGEQMHGWYLDAYYHLPKYEKFTLVGRVEQLKPGSSLPNGEQVTLGLRYTATPDWVFSVNWRKNNGNQFYAPTWTPYAGKGGDFLFQVYHKIHY